jgi:hypothetical protein
MMQLHKLTTWLACGALLVAFGFGSLVFGQGGTITGKDPGTTSKGKKHHKGHHRPKGRRTKGDSGGTTTPK